MTRTQRIASIDALRPFAADWNRLAGGVPFRRWEWVEAWWEQFADAHELYVLVVHDAAGSVIGFAPWFQEQSLKHGRVTRWLGSGAACSDYMSLLTTPEHQSLVAQAIADWLAKSGSDESRGDAWDLLRLEAVEATDSAVNELVDRLTENGHTAHCRPGPNCWRVPVPTSWEDYSKALSKPNRRKARWAEKHLRDNCVVGEIPLQDNFDRVWDALVDLHQRRWKSVNQPGCFACDRFARFLRAATERLLADGSARLVSVEREGRILAVQLHLCDAENTYAYQVGVSLDDLAESPGWLVNVASLLAAHRSGQSGFDLLRGDEPYKAHLGAEPRPTNDIRVVSRRVGAQLRGGAWLAGDALRNWIKGGLEISGLGPRN